MALKLLASRARGCASVGCGLEGGSVCRVSWEQRTPVRLERGLTRGCSTWPGRLSASEFDELAKRLEDVAAR